MALPTLNKTKDNVTVVNAFLGLNKGLHIQDNEFYDMTNMTNDYFPVLTTRKKRGIVGTLTKPQGVCGGDKLAYVDNDALYYDFEKICDLQKTGNERQLVMVGAYLCVYPDGIVYNTYTRQTPVTVENETSTSGAVTMQMCKFDGTAFTSSNTHIGSTEPSDKTTYPYWIDTSGKEAILKMWSSNYSMWTSVATTYVKISATGIGKGFKKYDSVRFSGITIKGYNDYDFNYNDETKNTLLLYDCADDYVLVAGLIDLVHTQTATVKLKRYLPDLDYVCQFDNRIWGCSSTNHEVYACKQGDPLNWECYAGLDSDSYAATVGSQGEFTGIAAYNGYMFFFKEDGFHKLYGTKPSNFEMIFKPCQGVAKGCAKSIALVKEVLFYKSRDGICAYDGSIETVSDKLGVEPYYEAVGSGYRSKYYVCMRDSEYTHKMYVYDMTKNTWVIEDDINALYMVYADNANYVITYDKEIFVINNEKITKKFFPAQTDIDVLYQYPSSSLYAGNIVSGEIEGKIDWSVTTGDLGLDNPYNKYVKRLNVRLQLDNETKIKVEVEYDTSGEWEYVCEYYCTHKRSYELPIPVRRADHLRLRLSGFGNIQLYSIAKAVEAGSGETNGES